jgi:hypothetical protein
MNKINSLCKNIASLIINQSDQSNESNKPKDLTITVKSPNNDNNKVDLMEKGYVNKIKSYIPTWSDGRKE